MLRCPHEPVPAAFEDCGCHGAFLIRCPEIPVDAERDVALARLSAVHRETADALGFAGLPIATAEQVHGNLVATLRETPTAPVPGADGLATDRPALCLGIYVADCAAVFLADRCRRAIALVHSGRRGTEAGICLNAVETLSLEFGSKPADLVAWISPCIRPPHYEVDFAASIRSQLTEAGVGLVLDSGRCTASNPGAYYSYRREKGRTGRMLALLALK